MILSGLEEKLSLCLSEFFFLASCNIFHKSSFKIHFISYFSSCLIFITAGKVKALTKELSQSKSIAFTRMVWRNHVTDSLPIFYYLFFLSIPISYHITAMHDSKVFHFDSLGQHSPNYFQRSVKKTYFLYVLQLNHDPCEVDSFPPCLRCFSFSPLFFVCFGWFGGVGKGGGGCVGDVGRIRYHEVIFDAESCQKTKLHSTTC